jgi:hypothetical protein
MRGVESGMTQRLLLYHAGVLSIFACIYYYLMPENFNMPPGTPTEPLTALYYASVTHVGLGYGDITPKTRKAKCVAMIHALLAWVSFLIIFTS